MRLTRVFASAALLLLQLLGGSTAYALSFSIAPQATPSRAYGGQTVSLSATVTADSLAANYNLGLQVYRNGSVYLSSASRLFTGVTLPANQAITVTSSWTVPADATPGNYRLLAGVWDSRWRWQTGTSVYFTVAAAGNVNVVNGACGSANGVAVASKPTAGLCSFGTASAVAGSGPWSWNCFGSGGGSTAACSAPLAASVVNGKCGSAAGKGFTTKPTTDLCSAGAPSAVGGSGPWTWSCAGSGGGTTALCSALLATNGVCGPANGVAVSAAPTTGLCSAGTATTVSGAGPWSWQCLGGNGGSTASCAAPKTTTAAAEKPGPSAQLFANPYYRCATNYYVAANGNDANNGTSPSTPWRTLQHANNALPTGGAAAGSCINVAPGTYANGVSITAGGNRASSTGYVVYRCTAMDACTVTDVTAGGRGAFAFNTRQPMTGNYVIIDGFRLTAAASDPFGQGVMLWAGSNNFTRSVHHVWILNSIISGYDQSGIQMNQGEYFYAIHNTIFNNANSAPGGCGAQGSGISFFKQIGVPGYTPTPDDLNNPMIGNVGSAFHNAIEWNVLYNNATTIACGGGNSDGNNIIIDTWNWAGVSGAIPYAGGGLVAFNVAYNAGGAGIALTNSLGVTVANNTCYNNFLDPNNPGSWRGCINSAGYAGSYGNTIINNIAIAVPAAHGTCAYNTPPYAMWNLAILAWPPTSGSLPLDTFSNNITQIQGGSTSCWRSDVKMYNGDSYSTTTNKLNTDPMFLDAGRTSVGTATTPPVGANFALQPGSPAIGYGLAKPYLSPQSVDVGACHHTLTACP